ncbi:MAG: ester cyclase [Pseudonocardia sp.]|nr:ester cyclase [Pseudonocardia sp.]
MRRWFGDALNSGSATVARAMSGQIFAADFVDHDGLDAATHGLAEWQQAVLATIFGAFAAIEVTIEHLLAEHDLVAVRYVFRGTHVGSFRGIQPTHRRIHHTENEIYRIAAGRIAESWGEENWLGTLRQLGVAAQ